MGTGMGGVLKAPVGWVPVRLVDTLMFIVRGSTERTPDAGGGTGERRNSKNSSGASDVMRQVKGDKVVLS